MNSEDVLVPATGNDGELEVIEISVSIGDDIETDDTIVVLESDKATVEVPSPKSGKVLEIAISVGDKVKEGAALLKLSTQLESSTSNNVKSHSDITEVSEAVVSAEKKNAPDTTEKKIKQILVPDLGGSEQVEVIEIVSAAGDDIEKDQTLIVLESDKATMEIPSPFGGKLLAICLSVGDKVSEGDLMAELEVAGEVPTSLNKDSVNQSEVISPPNKIESNNFSLENNSLDVSHTNTTVHAGPSVRKFSREHGVNLDRVKPSGPKHRILVEDVTAYIKSQVQQSQSGAISSSNSILVATPLPDFSKYGEISMSSMSNVQFKTAENMQRSWSIPQVTQFDEVDITAMEVFRKSQKPVAEVRGLKLTPIAFILKACAYALKALPQFNVSLDLSQKQLIQKQYIHIGFAVDTPHGLFVPVIKDVDKKSIWALAEECQDLANRAKEKKLSPTEMQGGCFTVSSLGAIGGTNFTPIVNAPEVAILGVSKAQMKPVFIDGNNFEARLMLPLSLSYDHRAVNGADGARFTTLLSKVMGDLRELLL